MLYSPRDLDMYIKHNMNVMFIGKHGTGKTTMILEAFKRNDINYVYFSGATMDPWVDFIGIPKERIDPITKKSHTELVRPKDFCEDSEVEAIFIDEYNRAREKVRNAVMELIQFREINGMKFPNLRFIWTAINPDDEDEDLSYDVERLDPAQKDRFPIQIDIPYFPSLPYFKKKYGMSGVGAVEWWKELSEEHKNLVSPRRLEYAVSWNEKGGDIRAIITGKEINVNALKQRLVGGSISVKLENLAANGTESERVEAFSNINFVTTALPLIIKNDEYIKLFLSYIPKEHISLMLSEEDGKKATKIIDNAPSEIISPIIGEILSEGKLHINTLQRIRTAAESKGLNITSELDFNKAIDEGMVEIPTGQQERYRAIHAVMKNFNKDSSLNTYKKVILFVAQVIYKTPESTLIADNGPFKQVCGRIISDTQKALECKGSSVLDIWDEVGIQYAAERERHTRITRHIKVYLE